MGTKSTFPIGTVPLAPISVTANDPAAAIPGDYSAYRKVYFAIYHVPSEVPAFNENVWVTQLGATAKSGNLIRPGNFDAVHVIGPYEPEEIATLGLYCAGALTLDNITPLVSSEGEIDHLTMP